MIQLDNPTWSALTSTHKHFALGSNTAKRYPANVLPFVAFDPNATEPLDTLGDIVTNEGVCIIGDLPEIPSTWTVFKKLECDQMVCSELISLKQDDSIEVLKLGEEDGPAMFELINSIQPGFYKDYTANLGSYYGIRIEGKLVAMAGERLKMTGLSEVSAVCTQPDHIGKGFAAHLVSVVCKNMIAQGNTPFLHVLSTNLRAVQLYERLGFVKRRSILFCLIKINSVK
ncbi:GNAT family N-acetyltransferase [Pedobacter hiemivivus]|uniref:GNAT family N-acetyltransferase n=1 Tax=Pedobacter hiemivivus TaxID=2530454 RepID=A0A4V2MKJ5_9SPHI|nr:GNAT family N-acetyltransferase [Pedobacter hiemivivus]TCC98366.1 GNAT family N-acetyltransferase [Pedobacter hiemivivus]TKC65088.1 GNAT family N-acetyltransferase [Pedobacter hiemivivus]